MLFLISVLTWPLRDGFLSGLSWLTLSIRLSTLSGWLISVFANFFCLASAVGFLLLASLMVTSVRGIFGVLFILIFYFLKLLLRSPSNGLGKLGIFSTLSSSSFNTFLCLVFSLVKSMGMLLAMTTLINSGRVTKTLARSFEGRAEITSLNFLRLLSSRLPLGVIKAENSSRTLESVFVEEVRRGFVSADLPPKKRKQSTVMTMPTAVAIPTAMPILALRFKGFGAITLVNKKVV